MERRYFMTTGRIGFSEWTVQDGALALLLWGDPQVTRFISATGIFSPEMIADRLHMEISNMCDFGVQYWPIFTRDSGELIGCCGLRPHGEASYEIGFHLRPAFWDMGLAKEATAAVIRHAFDELHAHSLFTGHHPANAASKAIILRLGFHYTGDSFYALTGLYHPSYLLAGSERPAILHR